MVCEFMESVCPLNFVNLCHLIPQLFLCCDQGVLDMSTGPGDDVVNL